MTSCKITTVKMTRECPVSFLAPTAMESHSRPHWRPKGEGECQGKQESPRQPGAFCFNSWWSRRDLNPRPCACKAPALPLRHATSYVARNAREHVLCHKFPARANSPAPQKSRKRTAIAATSAHRRSSCGASETESVHLRRPRKARDASRENWRPARPRQLYLTNAVRKCHGKLVVTWHGEP